MRQFHYSLRCKATHRAKYELNAFAFPLAFDIEYNFPLDIFCKYLLIVFQMARLLSLPQVALKYVKKYGVESIRVLTLTKNRGKGGAVRLVNRYFMII